MNDMKLEMAAALVKLVTRMNEEDNVRKADGFLEDKQIEPCVLLQSYFLLIDFMIESSSFKGKIIDFSGDNTIDKATVYYYAIAKAQETWSDIPAAIIDTENSFKLKDAQKSGVNIGKLLVSHSYSGIETLDSLLELCNAGVKLIVVDSIASLIPQSEGCDSKDVNMNARSKIFSKSLSKIHTAAEKNQTMIIFANQEELNCEILKSYAFVSIYFTKPDKRKHLKVV